MADLGLSSNPINPGSFPDLGPSSNPRWVSRTLSGAEGEPNPNPGSNACGGRMRYAPSMLYSKFFLDYLPLWLFFLSLSLALGQRLPG